MRVRSRYNRTRRALSVRPGATVSLFSRAAGVKSPESVLLLRIQRGVSRFYLGGERFLRRLGLRDLVLDGFNGNGRFR